MREMFECYCLCEDKPTPMRYKREVFVHSESGNRLINSREYHCPKCGDVKLVAMKMWDKYDDEGIYDHYLTKATNEDKLYHIEGNYMG